MNVRSCGEEAYFVADDGKELAVLVVSLVGHYSKLQDDVGWVLEESLRRGVRSVERWS